MRRAGPAGAAVVGLLMTALVTTTPAHAAPRSHASSGDRWHYITGRVFAPDGQPLANARVTTELTRAPGAGIRASWEFTIDAWTGREVSVFR